MRSQIRGEISGIVPFDTLEQEQIADALAWVDSGVDLCRLMKPDTPPKHLVSYFVVVDGAAILLVDHKNAGRWLPTGGHVEPGEHPRSTVARELAEELGLPLSHPVGTPVLLTSSATVDQSICHIDVSLWYVIHGSRQQTIQFVSDEFNAVRWFDFDEIPFSTSDPHLARFLKKLGADL